MKARRIMMISTLALMMVLLVLVVEQRIGRSADLEPQSIGLADGGEVEGLLLRLEVGSYIVQTADKCLIVGPDDINSVEGERGWMADPPRTNRVVRSQETYEVITPDGDLELHSRIVRKNTGSKVIHRLDWGLAPHEYASLSHYKLVDEYGNILPYEVEDDPKNNRKLVKVELARPVLPGESIQMTVIILESDRIQSDGGLHLYRHRGDYPDDRLVTRSVRLPQGAQIISVDPKPLQILESTGHKLVVWRRYFTKGEVAPWEIRYKL